MKKFVKLTTLLLFVFCIQIQGQSIITSDTEAVTKDGKTVILKPDGTWILKPETKLNQTNDNPSTVYFYRVEEAGYFDSDRVRVILDGKRLFMMPEERFIGINLKPGKYGLIMKQEQSEMLLQVEAGKTYFVKVSRTAAGMGYKESLSIIPNEQAIFQMRSMLPLEDKNIVDKSINVIKEKPNQ